MKRNYEIGGKVRVNSEWHDITWVEDDWLVYHCAGRDWSLPVRIVSKDDYLPPPPPVRDEWLAGVKYEFASKDSQIRRSFENALQDKYGRPSEWERKDKISELFRARMNTEMVPVSYVWEVLAEIGISKVN